MKTSSKNIGHVDAVAAGFVRGWALQKFIFGRLLDVEVRVLSEGLIIASTRANIHRPDLKQQGYGGGNYGFNIRLPEAVLSGGPYKILVVSSPGEHLLTDGDITLFDGNRRKDEESFAAQKDNFLSVHSALQYSFLQETIRDAVGVMEDIGEIPALCLLYARILGRMPEANVISALSEEHFNFSGIVERANKLFFSEEASNRRG